MVTRQIEAKSQKYCAPVILARVTKKSVVKSSPEKPAVRSSPKWPVVRSSPKWPAVKNLLETMEWCHKVP
ncbi:unnamed protein product [Arabis nemorensis]|uniref:Uncharacterized protein n=1 Tax=Arabis nemorensis TaxID=586526 RepID=A0A565AYC4_9BRAS|nr:unnamed protein product [Arabis nemorensis]